MTFHRAWIPFLAISAQVREMHTLLAISVHGFRPSELALAPTLGAAMEGVGIWAVVCCQSVGFPVEVGDLGVFDAVRGTAYGLPKIRGMVGFVVCRGGKGEDNIVAGDIEFLN